jgi:hypothetical protein
MSLFDEGDSVLPDDQQENLTDLLLTDSWYVGPSLWSTDWTTETIVSQLKRGNINLNPRYQRRNAWNDQRKSLFVESLLLGLPVPQLVLAEDKNKRGNFIVIDGKQRLLALRQFSVDATDTAFPQLRLSGLEDKPELNGVTYRDLLENPNLESELNTFDNQTIRTVVIRGWKDERYLYSVFLRINTGSVQLSPQELRQALHPGPFSDFIDDFSVDSVEIKKLLKLNEPDFRMRDVELVLRFFAYLNFSEIYDGNLKRFLDTTAETFNEDWVEANGMLVEQAGSLDEAIKAVRRIFGDRDAMRKWNGKSFERRINRAVFDIMVYYFSSKKIRDLAISAPPEGIKEAFKRLCSEDREFLSSIEQTTKSIEANRVRFNKWASALSRIFQIDVPSPFNQNAQ